MIDYKDLEACSQHDRAFLRPGGYRGHSGIGLGGFEEELLDPISIAYDEIPAFRIHSARHAGRFIVGTIRDHRVLLMSGRFHSYEAIAWTRSPCR